MSSSSSSAAHSSAAAHWQTFSACVARLESLRAVRAARRAAAEPASALKAREGVLGAALDAAARERAALPLALDERDERSAGAWARHAELEAEEARLTAARAALKLRRYFPGAAYSLSAPAAGLYLSFSDVYLASLAGAVALEASPARGEVWVLGQARSSAAAAAAAAHCTPAAASLRLAGLALSLQIDELGIRGPSVPMALRSIRELQLDMTLDAFVPLAFVPPAPGAAAAAAAAPSARRGLDRLLDFRWAIQPAVDFKISRLHVKTRGASVPLPDALLRWALNALIPPRIKAVVADMLPLELGVVLSLHGC